MILRLTLRVLATLALVAIGWCALALLVAWAGPLLRPSFYMEVGAFLVLASAAHQLTGRWLGPYRLR